MSLEERVSKIKALEGIRKSRVLTYVTGDRGPDLQTRIGMDIIPLFYDVLARMGKQQQIDLFIYSTGGVTMAAWGLVNLLREFCDRLAVLVPFRAYSSATLIALGANEIVMSKMGQLSPVDPTVSSPFNPTLPSDVPGTPPNFLPLSVEDVVSFMDLVRDEAKISGEAHMAEIMKVLASDVRPIALGNVYRAKQQIGMLARKLLGFHIDPDREQSRINHIVETLTRKLYSHDYLVGRREAKEQIGLQVENCSEDLESAIMALYDVYAGDLELGTAFNPDVVLGNQSTKVVEFDRAFIESSDCTYVFHTKREVKRVKATKEGIQLEGFQHRTLEDAWRIQARKAA
jgi:hypothetical protein